MPGYRPRAPQSSRRPLAPGYYLRFVGATRADDNGASLAARPFGPAYPRAAAATYVSWSPRVRSGSHTAGLGRVDDAQWGLVLRDALMAFCFSVWLGVWRFRGVIGGL